MIELVFSDSLLVKKVQDKLPKLFQLAELESSRAGKIGMEVGSLRERIIVALMIYKFGKDNVDTDIPITEAEIDVKVCNNPISIKTITGAHLSGVKLIWTVDTNSVLQFRDNYIPNIDILLVQINWNKFGGLYFIPKMVQQIHFHNIGKENYIKLPKVGTNPRGAEIAAEALKVLIADKGTFKIPIEWRRESINYNSFERWVDLWQQD